MKKMPIFWTILLIVVAVFYFTHTDSYIIVIIFLIFYFRKYSQIQTYNRKIKQLETELPLCTNLYEKAKIWNKIINKETNMEFVKYAWQQIQSSIIKNGIVAQNIKTPVAVGKKCYYTTSVGIVKQRTANWKKYFDIKNAEPATLYIFEDTMEWIAQGHRTIPISRIIEINISTDYKLVSFILRNEAASINFYSTEAKIIQCIIPLIQKERM